MAASDVALLLALAGTVGIPGAQQTDGQEPQGTAPILYVSYYDQAGLEDGVHEAMASEVERVFGAIGLSVHEVSTNDLADGRLPAGRIPLRVLVLGRSPMDWDLKPGTLGVMIGEEVPPAAVYAFAPTIERTLGISNRAAGYLMAEEIGRAYGRVVVHEIVHAFAPDHPHRGSGIMGHEQDAGSLIQADLTIDPESTRAFLKAWRRIEAGANKGDRLRRASLLATLTLVVYDTAGVDRIALTAFEHEVKKILGEAEIETRLLWDPEAFPWEDPVVLRVLIRNQEPSVMNLPDDVLGTTYGVGSDSIIQLFLPPLVRTLGLSLDGSLEEWSPASGRALARVLLHEIVHALAPDSGHRPRSIMDHVQHRRYLLGEDVELEQGMQEMLVRRLAEVARR